VSGSNSYPAAVRILVVSDRFPPGRRRAWLDIAPPGSTLEFTGYPGSSAPEATPTFGDLGSLGALVFDGPPAAPFNSDLCHELRSWITGGGTLLAVQAAPPAGADVQLADLLGVVAEAAIPRAEMVAEVVEPRDPRLRRLDRQLTIVDSLHPLRCSADDADSLLEVSVGFSYRPALVSRRMGHGAVVVSGFGGEAALASRPFASVIRRMLRPPTGHSEAALGVGVVGYGPYGGMGFLHGTAVTNTAGLELVATCDRDPDRRKASEEDFPGVRAHATVAELAADDDVDIAVVATSPNLHFAVALELLSAGMHVVTEKPLCFTVAEADELARVAAANGRILTVHQNRRWDRDYLALRRAVDASMVGEVFNVETFVGGYEHPCRAWHSETSVSGGAAYDWGSHHVDWVLQIMGGPPAKVSGLGHKRVWHDVTNLDQLRVRMRWPDGREAEFLQSDVAAVRRPKFLVQGTQGTIVGHYRPVTTERIDPARGWVREVAHHAEAPADLTLARYESQWGLTQTALPLAPEKPFAFHRNLADHLLLGEPLAVTLESVRQVVAVLECATASAADGGAELECPESP